MLIAFKDPELNCFANKGDWLYIARKKDTKKGLFRLPRYIHFFASINGERMPSEFGVVNKKEGSNGRSKGSKLIFDFYLNCSRHFIDNWLCCCCEKYKL